MVQSPYTASFSLPFKKSEKVYFIMHTLVLGFYTLVNRERVEKVQLKYIIPTVSSWMQCCLLTRLEKLGRLLVNRHLKPYVMGILKSHTFFRMN